MSKKSRENRKIQIQSLANLPVSYAQESEDIILNMYLHTVQAGFYIDIGSNHPEILSVTKLFYDKGWSGINIDPLQSCINLCITERPRDTNICIGISDQEGTLDFFEAGAGSTFDPEIAARWNFPKTATVRVTKLSSLLDELGITREIHFLKIDVEKLEKEVLLGCDFKKYRPWMVAVESTIPFTATDCFDEWEYILLENDYIFLAMHGINRYYGAKEQEKNLVNNYIKAPLLRYISSDQQKAIKSTLNSPFIRAIL